MKKTGEGKKKGRPERGSTERKQTAKRLKEEEKKPIDVRNYSKAHASLSFHGLVRKNRETKGRKEEEQKQDEGGTKEKSRRSDFSRVGR